MRLRLRSNKPGLGSSTGRTWRLGVALVVPLAFIAATIHATGGSSASGAPGASARTMPATALPADPGRQSCVANRLMALGGGHGNATAVSSNGLVVGIASDSEGHSYPVLWKGGKTIKIPTTLFAALPTGVNRHGVVVGTAYRTGADMPVGWWWVVGQQVRLLPVSSGEVAIPEAINDDGAVVGAITNEEEDAEGDGADVVDDVERATYWPSVHGSARPLGPLQGDEGAHAYAVSSRGVVGGVSAGADFRPVIWDRRGRPTMLLTSGSRAGIVRGFARGGLPMGEAVLPGRGMQYVQWDKTGRAHRLGRQGVLATLRFGSRSTAKLPAATVARAGTIKAVAVAATAAGKGTLLVGYTEVSDGSRFATRWRCS